MSFFLDLRFALRSLARAKGLTVVVPIVGAAAVLVAAAILASLMPAARASRVDVISALRGE